jgi:hypothetical protein
LIYLNAMKKVSELLPTPTPRQTDFHLTFALAMLCVKAIINNNIQAKK